jgi:hypothetical protein
VLGDKTVQMMLVLDRMARLLLETDLHAAGVGPILRMHLFGLEECW